ncbi:MATE family efflux transporter [Psychromonas sp. KJ10-10]|uniref:MATE family efflux transporter n=1 Tax=Psychromonas sp. KJ10-10 TaxID=3391823 RepID=UPI0039B38A12
MLRLTIPAMLSQFIPPISAMIVTIIIASYGDLAIGAWGLANRIEYISIILILALTMALPPMIGKLKGMNETAKILALVKVAVMFVMCFQIILALILYLFAPLMSSLLTNQAEISAILQNYLWIVPLSYGALGVCMICVSACNAMSSPKSALLISMLRLFACYLPLIWIGSELYGLLGVFIGACIGNFLSGILAWNMFLKQDTRYHSRCKVQQVVR